MKLEDLEKTNRNFTKNISSTVTNQTYFDLNILAQSQGTDVSKIVRSLVCDFLNENSEFLSELKRKLLKDRQAESFTTSDLPQGPAYQGQEA